MSETDVSVPGRPFPTNVADVFEQLSDERRCAVLVVLHDRSGPLSVADLAACVRDLVPDVTGDTQLRVELEHRHLPKLADGDLIAYDADAGTVAPGPAFGTAYEALDRVCACLDRGSER